MSFKQDGALASDPPSSGTGPDGPIGIEDVDGLEDALNGKAPAPTGSPNGSKFYADDGTWKVVSDVDVRPLFFGGTTGGTAPNYTVTPTPAWSSYVHGRELYFKAHAANGGLATINVSGLGNRQIWKSIPFESVSPLATNGGEFSAGGWYRVVYDSVLDAFVLFERRLTPRDMPYYGNLEFSRDGQVAQIKAADGSTDHGFSIGVGSYSKLSATRYSGLAIGHDQTSASIRPATANGWSLKDYYGADQLTINAVGLNYTPAFLSAPVSTASLTSSQPDYVDLLFGSAAGAYGLAGYAPGVWTFNRAGLVVVRNYLRIVSDTDIVIFARLNGEHVDRLRINKTEISQSFLMQVEIGDEFTVSWYNYGSTVAVSGGSILMAMLGGST